MNDHVWAQEQIASYLAGGLDAAEKDRLDRHAKECPECAAALEAAVHFDRGLGTLFAPLRPKPGLEDRAIQSTRTAPKPVVLFLGWPRRAASIAASLIMVISLGAIASNLMKDGDLPIPGLARETTSTFSFVGSSIAPPSGRVSGVEPAKSLTNEDRGLESNLETALSLDKLADKTVKDIVRDDIIGVPDPRADDNVALKTPGLPPYSSRGMNPPADSRHYSYNGAVPGGSPNPTGPFNFYMGYEGGKPAQGAGMGPPIGGSAGGPPGPGGFPQTGFPAPTSLPVVPIAPGKSGGATTYFVPSDTSLFSRESKGKDDNDKRDKGDLKEGIKDGAPKPTPANGEQKPDGSDPKLPPPPPGTGVPPAVKNPEVTPEPTRRIVIRSGDIEFEVESFDSALATVTQLVTKIKGAFVGTVNSDKLPNGKVRGSIIVRTPPEFLDNLVLDLRKELGKGGELKSVKLNAADVTKQYTDTESRLRAARAMETRLLAIIKDGKGEIKQLLEAEKELGNWRTKIEESEGELRYYANLAALSTLTITLQEKEIRAAVGVTENERVQAGVEVEDVDKTYQALMKEVIDAKGRVTKSEVRLLAAGQYDATLNFEVAPEASGTVRDRLRQIGRVARLEIDRQQQADGAVVPKDAKVKRGDTQFFVKLYNLANIAPRETATIAVAAPDVATAYNSIRDALAKASARVQNAQLNETDKNNITAQLDFDIKRTDEGAIRTALAAAGESLSRQVVRAPESDSVTDTKIAYKVSLSAAARLRPRDSITLQIAVNDVPAAYNALRQAAAAGKGRIFTSQLNENDKQNVNASLDFDVQRTDESAVKTALESSGETVSRQIARAAENEAATDSKVFYSVKLLPANGLKPRETTVLGLEVPDVDQAMAVFIAQLNEVKGRQIDAKSGRERGGKSTAKLVYEVPLATASGLVERFKSAGTVRVLNTSRDPLAPEGKSATARVEVTMSTPDTIVSPDETIWQPVKKGLTHSASVLMTSLTWLVFGLCVILPWALVGYGGYKVVKRVTRPGAAEAPSVPPPATESPAAST